MTPDRTARLVNLTNRKVLTADKGHLGICAGRYEWALWYF